MKKVGRNDPCHCGSGKKYKQCCLLRDTAQATEMRTQHAALLAGIPDLIKTAIAHHQAGRLLEAETIYRQVLQVDPHDPDALHLLGVVARHAGRYDEAVALINKAIQLLSTEANFYNNLGPAYRALGRLDEAMACYRKAIKLRPDHADAYNNLANILFDQGKLDEAVGSYLKALEINPAYPEAFFNIGNVFRDQFKYEDAIACYHKAIELYPDYVEALSGYGFVLNKTGDSDGAVVCFEKAIAIAPAFASAHLNLGCVLRDQGKLEAAISCFEKALSLKPDYPEVLSNYGLALWGMCQSDKALTMLQNALILNPDLVDAHINMGLIFKETGRTEEAIACFEKVAARDVDALNYLSGAQKDMGRLDDALVSSRKALSIAPLSIAGLESAVRLGIMTYLQSDWAEAARMVECAKPILQMRNRPAQAYCRYLGNLLSWWRETGAQYQGYELKENLYVIGDSHILSTHGLPLALDSKPLMAKGLWIEGCKQWHLGNDEVNAYKRQFASMVAALPFDANILIAVGEIDCRPNEGIFSAWKKDPHTSLEALAEKTINNFVNYVSATANAHARTLIIQGVPATNYDLEAMSADDAMLYCRMMEYFNTVLRHRTFNAGMCFLDVFAMTNLGDGRANGAWHIDANHLRPDAMIHAFSKQMLYPNAA